MVADRPPASPDWYASGAMAITLPTIPAGGALGVGSYVAALTQDQSHVYVGRPVTMLIPEDRPDEEPGILERIGRGERIEHYETVRRRKDGKLVDVSLTVSPVREVRPSCYCGSSRPPLILSGTRLRCHQWPPRKHLRKSIAGPPVT